MLKHPRQEPAFIFGSCMERVKTSSRKTNLFHLLEPYYGQASFSKASFIVLLSSTEADGSDSPTLILVQPGDTDEVAMRKCH